MTVLSDSNPDAYSLSPDTVATGPLVGFFESWSASVDAQMRTSSQFGIEYFMHELDWQQTRALLDAGVSSPPQLMLSLEDREAGEGSAGDFSVAQMLREDSGYYEDFIPNRSGEYMQVARRYAGDETSPEFEKRLRDYDAQIAKLREQHPDLELRSSREMFEQVRKDAAAAEQREQTDRRTWGGAVGGFLGGAVASMHPGTDPFNFYTMAAGGAGKTAAQRIFSQVGAQGAIETVNQVTGVQEGRQLLGLSHGLSDAAQRVAATALGAGVLQGAGEAVFAGARRWFRNTETDPAPPLALAERPAEPLPQITPDNLIEEARLARIEQDPRAYSDMLAAQAPLSGVKAGRPRSVVDLADASAQLEDWAGAAPAAVRPRTSSATYPTSPPRTAQEVDPPVFVRYDRNVERRNELRAQIEADVEGRDAEVHKAMGAVDARIHALEARLRATQGGGDAAELRKEVSEARKDRGALLRVSESKEAPEVASARRRIAKLDDKAADIVPLIGRARARARGRWGVSADDLDDVWGAYREGRTGPDTPAGEALEGREAMLALTDRAPVLQGAGNVEPAATSAETAQRIIAENTKTIDAALEGYRTQVKKLVDVSEEGKLKVDGREYEFDIDRDKLFVPNEDGNGGKEVTLREYLAENKRVEDELEGVSTCSTR